MSSKALGHSPDHGWGWRDAVKSHIDSQHRPSLTPSELAFLVVVLSFHLLLQLTTRDRQVGGGGGGGLQHLLITRDRQVGGGGDPQHLLMWSETMTEQQWYLWLRWKMKQLRWHENQGKVGGLFAWGQESGYIVRLWSFSSLNTHLSVLAWLSGVYWWCYCWQKY